MLEMCVFDSDIIMETLHVLTFGYDDVIVKFKRFTGTLSGKKKKRRKGTPFLVARGGILKRPVHLFYL